MAKNRAKNRAKKGKERVSAQEEGFELGGGLAGALSLAGFEPPPEPPPPSPSPPSTTPGDGADHGDEPHLLSPLGPKRALKLAISKRGRGGKTVTTLKPVQSASESVCERLAQALGRALGCRAWLGEGDEEGFICLQGDQRARVEAWVKAQP
mgnify:CR=1 FL=1